MDTPSITAGTPAPVVSPAPSLHASLFHSIFSELERIIGLAADPAVLALLPAKYQGYAAAALVVEQIVQSVVAPAPAAPASPPTP